MEKMKLSINNKYRIAYDYFIDNISIHEISNKLSVSSPFVQEFLTELINNPSVRNQYLPNYNEKRALNECKFGGYYEDVKEMEIGEIPKYPDDINETILPDPGFERRSFTERLNDKLQSNERKKRI